MIVSCLYDASGVSLKSATEALDSPHIGNDVGELAGLGKNGIFLETDLLSAIDKCDVVIDFTLPEVTMQTFRTAIQLNKAIVIGTTGFSSSQKEEIQNSANNTRCVLAPNMSIGINVLFKISETMAKILGDDFDVEIVEAHHRFKKDAPSGTAVRLSEILATSLNRNIQEVGIYGRKGLSSGRDSKEIGIHTIRAGDIIGEHEVIFGGIGETMKISHHAQSRETFARGSIQAARWILNQPPGIYDMQDVLGLT